jgi:hypothetical protein
MVSDGATIEKLRLKTIEMVSDYSAVDNPQPEGWGEWEVATS